MPHDANPNFDKILELKGSEQHHDLKNQPGKAGDPDHAKYAGAEDVKDLVKRAVDSSDPETELAAAFKDAMD